MGWITEQGTDYCEGDKPYGNYWVEVPTRPSALHIYVNNVWVLDPVKVIGEFETAVQTYMDDAAKLRGYDSLLSACTYVTSSSPKFSAEGIAFSNWRDAVWTKCFEIQLAVQAGARGVPSLHQLMAELPLLAI